MRIDPLLTSSPLTGAIRPITTGLLRDSHLAPAPRPLDFAATLAGRPAPWSESLAAAPDTTARAVENALTAVMRATTRLDPAELAPERLPQGRARTHLTALRDLWRDADPMPETLAVVRHVLGCGATDCLEPLPLLDVGIDAFADPVEASLAEVLLRHHGTVPEADRRAWRARQPGGSATGALGHVQKHLGRDALPTARDDGLRFFGLRDPREEAEFAAALAQSLLDDGRVDQAGDIGLLIPDDAAYAPAIADAFHRLGVPLSDAAMPARRDLEGELLSALLAVLEGPAPRTALATLHASPLMPWPGESGRRMAREIIDRGWSRTAAELDGPGHVLLDAFRPVSTPEQLVARLFAVAAALPGASLAPRIAAIRAVLGEAIDWPALRRLVEPLPLPAEGTDRAVEGASLFDAAGLPWRPVRHLIVLGLAGPNWPRPPVTSPVFTEGEIALIRHDIGLPLAGRQDHLARGLELFRRQLLAATEAATLLVPARDLRGKALAPSTGLALICNLLGEREPQHLVRDLRSEPAPGWPVGHQAVAPRPVDATPDLPDDGRLRLDADLLRLHDTGAPVPQSPSRLETLLYSPLAWALDEVGAKDRTWRPEAPDVRVLGSLTGRVLEVLFPKDDPVPEDAVLAAAAPAALAEAIARIAPWLSGPHWAAERAGLEREVTETVHAWARFLRASGATVLGNEIELAGDHGGLLIAGRADTLLRMPEGRLLLIDHKRSRSRGRRERMVKGWDLQVALYRAMLERPLQESDLSRLAAAGAPPVTGYHTTLDSTVLVDAGGADIPGAEAVSDDISGQAMAQLAARVAEAGAGVIALNRAGDLKRFEKDCGITAYALKDNRLVMACQMPDGAGEEDGDE